LIVDGSAAAPRLLAATPRRYQLTDIAVAASNKKGGIERDQHLDIHKELQGVISVKYMANMYGFPL
jgi:hypothetical protein